MTRPGSITRRTLLQAGGAATLAACLGGAASSSSAAAAGGTTPPAYLRRATYAALDVPRELTAAGPGGPLTLSLDGVGDVLGAGTDAALRGSEDTFAVRFSGAPGDVVLEQGIHLLSHPQLGAFELFLAPVDLPAAGQQYEIVIDRSVARA
ncbi:DUF6916 family protein [Conexibacter woesei]|uniref:DUF6916 domain-containing protein n=1 Tax=Conexibacter woesei (strain DSM 14684 / CCUG 47730 / CIP 108061 / JCM 11494 / NBRC 100937 / ID131577) TaxID=469383 RepID=D3F8S3_CONWI|nr:hypothetical protein [Conexibacter woesei]ADB51037.1 conserved hypothetical protein [Conexibacter woesei DSM 14684]